MQSSLVGVLSCPEVCRVCFIYLRLHQLSLLEQLHAHKPHEHQQSAPNLAWLLKPSRAAWCACSSQGLISNPVSWAQLAEASLLCADLALSVAALQQHVFCLHKPSAPCTSPSQQGNALQGVPEPPSGPW